MKFAIVLLTASLANICYAGFVVLIAVGTVIGGGTLAGIECGSGLCGRDLVGDIKLETSSTTANGWPIAPAGVPQYNFDDCMIDLTAHTREGGKITISVEDEEHNVKVEPLPPRCMVLANSVIPITGSGPYPIPLSTSTLEWRNVTGEQLDSLRNFFQTRKK